MSWVQRVLAEVTIRAEQPVVMRAQLRALGKQLPLLYATLCTNAIALAFTHSGVAPRFLTLLVPLILIPICVARVIAWRSMVADTLTDAAVVYQLRRTMVLVALLGVSFTAWSLVLYPYGDAYAKAHVAFFMSITVVGCLFCLIHLRPAALLLTAIVIVPFTFRFVSTGHPVLTAIAINFLIVSIVMTFMMLAYYDDFRQLVRGRDELARMSEENRRAAHIDILTGIANRRRFFEDLADAIERHTTEEATFALGLIDLDGFKPINDLYGHQAGDAVLVEVSRRLEATVADRATIARLGGDEFALIVPKPAGREDLQRLGRTICTVLASPIPLAEGLIKVTASVGFAIFPIMGRSGEQLIERADFALYHAKERDRGTAVIFTADHADQIRDRRQLEYELRSADIDAEFWMAFQPMVDVTRNRIISFEALARWNSPRLGPISPGAFIPAAERIGVIRHLTHALFRKACDAARAWPDAIRLSFNLSIDDLMNDQSIERLTGMVDTCGLAPHRIMFEVTETAVMHDFVQASATLNALRALGCRIALDDFGTGYSSLSYVHRLPLDKIKIDQSFVRSLISEQTSRKIIESIVNLSQHMQVGCTVEGVETAEQIEVLRSIGCSTMQGYFFGRPMAQDAVLQFLRKFNAALGADLAA